jgi:hypothetical protein
VQWHPTQGPPSTACRRLKGAFLDLWWGHRVVQADDTLEGVPETPNVEDRMPGPRPSAPSRIA